jgi:hypothetical protein
LIPLDPQLPQQLRFVRHVIDFRGMNG